MILPQKKPSILGYLQFGQPPFPNVLTAAREDSAGIRFRSFPSLALTRWGLPFTDRKQDPPSDTQIYGILENPLPTWFDEIPLRLKTSNIPRICVIIPFTYSIL